MDIVMDFKKLKEIDYTGITFLDEKVYKTYQELYDNSYGAFHILKERGVKKGDTLIFQMETPYCLLCCFFACVIGGFKAVLTHRAIKSIHCHDLLMIHNQLQKSLIIADSALYLNQDVEVCYLNRQMIEENSCFEEGEFLCDKQKLEHLVTMFSSGTTGKQKEIHFSYSRLNILLENYYNNSSIKMAKKVLNWLPADHQFGFFTILINILIKNELYVSTTNYFLTQPNYFFEFVSKNQIDFTSSTNGLFNILVNNLDTNESHLLDLSKLTVITGGDPLSKKVYLGWVNKLLQFHIANNFITPVYANTECSLVAVANDGVQFDVEKSEKIYKESVCLGPIIDTYQYKIVDLVTGNNLDSGVGSLFLKNVDVFKDSMVQLSEDDWFDTGDVGYIKEGKLYLTSRKKDVYIQNGLKYHMSDFEIIAEELYCIEPGTVKFIGTYIEDINEEQLIAFVVYKKNMDQFTFIQKDLKEHIYQETGIIIADIIPIDNIPVTSSGKISNRDMLEYYKEYKAKV